MGDAWFPWGHDQAGRDFLTKCVYNTDVRLSLRELDVEDGEEF